MLMMVCVFELGVLTDFDFIVRVGFFRIQEGSIYGRKTWLWTNPVECTLLVVNLLLFPICRSYFKL